MVNELLFYGEMTSQNIGDVVRCVRNVLKNKKFFVSLSKVIVNGSVITNKHGVEGLVKLVCVEGEEDQAVKIEKIESGLCPEYVLSINYGNGVVVKKTVSTHARPTVRIKSDQIKFISDVQLENRREITSIIFRVPKI